MRYVKMGSIEGLCEPCEFLSQGLSTLLALSKGLI
jgi:hypothetical protein